MNIRILQQIEGARAARGLTVIIDVFRAFTVEAYLAQGGAARIIPVGDVETAFALRDQDPENTLLCGERGGVMIEGFDLGNSPTQVAAGDVAGKTVVHTTSAGTQGIVNARGADEIIGGSLVAAEAIATYIKEKNPKEVSLVCMGLAGKTPTDEDTLCAEYLKSLLEARPLPDMEERMAALAKTTGAKFFDPARQSVFPKSDFYLCTRLSTVPFVLRLGEDGVMETISV